MRRLYEGGAHPIHKRAMKKVAKSKAAERSHERKMEEAARKARDRALMGKHRHLFSTSVELSPSAARKLRSIEGWSMKEKPIPKARSRSRSRSRPRNRPRPRSNPRSRSRSRSSPRRKLMRRRKSKSKSHLTSIELDDFKRL
jgi:hypothetical protein